MIRVLFSPICEQKPDLSQLALNRTANTTNRSKHLLKLLLVLSKIKDSVAMLWLWLRYRLVIKELYPLVRKANWK